MKVLPAGRHALLVEVANGAAALALYAQARAHEVAVTDLVLGARTVLFDGVEDVGALRDELGAWRLDRVDLPAPAPVEVPTVYDGADLDEVAHHWGMTPAEVVGTHTSTDFTVAFCGFAPGFAYCTGLPDRLLVPRRATPRPRVPAGSVALADTYTGVYPTESPGGWQLIGRTALTLWDAGYDPPALLVPGTPVRFVEVAG